MKNKMKLLAVIAFTLATVFCLAACSGNSGSNGSSDSGNQGSKSSAEKSANYTFGTEKVRVWESVNNTLIEIQVPITNNSNELLYCRTVEYKLVNAKGEAAFTATASDMAPLYLEPGDTGIIYHMQKYMSETPYSDDLKLEYKATIEVASWTVKSFEASNLTFEQPLGTGYIIRGNITNNSDKDLEMAQVSIRLYDAQGNIIGGAYGYADGTIKAGETGTFVSQRYEVEGGRDNIASYKAIAYVTE